MTIISFPGTNVSDVVMAPNADNPVMSGTMTNLYAMLYSMHTIIFSHGYDNSSNSYYSCQEMACRKYLFYRLNWE